MTALCVRNHVWGRHGTSDHVELLPNQVPIPIFVAPPRGKRALFKIKTTFFSFVACVCALSASDARRVDMTSAVEALVAALRAPGWAALASLASRSSSKADPYSFSELAQTLGKKSRPVVATALRDAVRSTAPPSAAVWRRVCAFSPPRPPPRWRPRWPPSRRRRRRARTMTCRWRRRGARSCPTTRRVHSQQRLPSKPAAAHARVVSSPVGSCRSGAGRVRVAGGRARDDLREGGHARGARRRRGRPPRRPHPRAARAERPAGAAAGARAANLLVFACFTFFPAARCFAPRTPPRGCARRGGTRTHRPKSEWWPRHYHSCS